jgi:hypothetical protein
LIDSLDTYFREGGATAYVSRAVGTGATSATLALAPSAAITFTAAYPGVGGNGIYVAVTNNTSNVVISLQDASGNVLATSPQLTTLAAIVSWAATTGLVTAVSSGSTLPSTASATAMAGGANGSTPTVTQLTTAINSFGPNLGPGQVLAPGYTNTSFSGIWAALAQHAQNNNRVAICDMDDNTSAATAVAALGTTFGTQAYASYAGFWAGNRNIPGTVPGTTRSVPPSPVIAALCSRVDATGNPNQPAAGSGYALQFATTPTSTVSGAPTDTYNLADLNTLNSSGINGFQVRFGVPENYGFVSTVSPTTDTIYWQLQHARLRMALVAQAMVVGEPFVFSQLDGQSSDITRFNSAIQNMLLGYYKLGALYGLNATDAFSVNTGSAINTPSSLAAGNLLAQVTYRPSPSAQLVTITLNAIPITQSVPQAANPAQGQ